MADVEEAAIAQATADALSQGLAGFAAAIPLDRNPPLPFPEDAFDLGDVTEAKALLGALPRPDRVDGSVVAC